MAHCEVLLYTFAHTHTQMLRGGYWSKFVVFTQGTPERPHPTWDVRAGLVPPGSVWPRHSRGGQVDGLNPWGVAFFIIKKQWVCGFGPAGGGRSPIGFQEFPFSPTGRACLPGCSSRSASQSGGCVSAMCRSRNLAAASHDGTRL